MTGTRSATGAAAWGAEAEAVGVMVGVVRAERREASVGAPGRGAGEQGARGWQNGRVRLDDGDVRNAATGT